MNKPIDRELGMHRRITRRDFVQGTSVAIGALAGTRWTGADAATDYAFTVGDDWYGPGGIGDYAPSHGNTPALIGDAHRIRAGEFDVPPSHAVDTGETFDLVIVGGGMAGLSAAHHFRRLRPDGRCLILDNHPIFGGEGKRNDFIVDGVRISGPQGSNDTVPRPATGDPDDYYTSLNLPRDPEYAEPEGDAAGMRIPFDNYAHMNLHHDDFDVGHYFPGAEQPWVMDIWRSGMSQTPWRPEVREAFLRLRRTEALAPDGQDLGPWLDSMTYREYLEGVLGMPPEVGDYYDPYLASIIGLGSDVLGAWWGKHFGMPGFGATERYRTISRLDSFPGGNAGVARHFIKNLIPSALPGERFEDIIFGAVNFAELDKPGNPVRLRLESTAVRVEHTAQERVRVTFLNGGRAHTLTAGAVVMASGGWVTRRVVRDLPEAHRKAYEVFSHSPMLVANVALTNWRFLVRRGVSAAIWPGGADELGFTCNIRRPMVVGGQTQPLHPDKPIVLTFYAPIIRPGLPRREQGIAVRAELLATSFSEYERRIREKMMELFGDSGLDPTNDIAGIILNRWGHAYLSPGPGFMYGSNGNPAPPDVIRQSFGRIAIGHSELRGHQYWTGAAGEGRRAVESLFT